MIGIKSGSRRWSGRRCAGAGLVVLLVSAACVPRQSYAPAERADQRGGVAAGTPSRPPAPYQPNDVVAANDWIQTDGRYVFYRYSTYLPDACKPGAKRQTFATGNFNGWGVSPVQCLQGIDWLAFDALSLLSRGAQYDVTYCVNFRDGAGAWGAHGRPPIAPGLEQFVVPTPRRQVGRDIRDWGQDGVNPGFRIVRTTSGPNVILASYRPARERVTIAWLGPSGVVLEPKNPGDPPC